MATCPTCRTQYSDDVSICAADGAGLLPDEAFSSADHDLVAGQIVGEYRIEAKIGEGGFGTVYRAVHPLIGKAAAIKVLNRQYSSSPPMVSRFIAEARAVNQIRNRNIIDIFSFGKLDDGRHYYVMELLDGVTLDAYLRQKQRLTVEEAMPILRGIARALDAAHTAGIAHRDLKPENIFLVFEDDGVVFPKLLDFGIAKLLGETMGGHKTRTGAPMGTPHYMSPEQCRGRNVDHRTDIYSFGVMIHQALTGARPFDGEEVMELLFKHTSEPPPRLSAVCPDLPAVLDAPVLRMLEKDPAARPASLLAALDALAQAAQGAGYAVQLSTRKPGEAARPVEGAITPSSVIARSSGATPTPAQADLAAASTMLQEEPSTSKTLGPSAADVRSAPSKRTLVLAVGAVAAVVLAAAVIGLRPRAPITPAAATTALPEKTAIAVVAATAPPPTVTPSAFPNVSTSASTEVAPALPVEIELTIEATPKIVDVYLGGTKLGTSEKPIRLKRAPGKVKLTFKAPGYAAKDLDVDAGSSAAIPIELSKSPPRSGAGRKSEIEF